MAPQPRTRMTDEEYLAFERESAERHEFDGVEMYAMSGGTEQHNLIAGNVYFIFRTHFRGRNCRAYTSDMRVHIPQTRLYTYPDVSALCGEPQFRGGVRDTLLNPTVIVEVLSPSTENYDRGVKFRNYRSLESLQEYVMIDQNAVHVDHYVRLPNGMWALSDTSNLADSLTLASIDCTLAVADIYEQVEFDEPQP